MIFVFLSPHFPPNYQRFASALKGLGVNVLGIADADYDSLAPELKSGLTEYYRVSDLHNYDELVRALGYFTHRYGKRTDIKLSGMSDNSILRKGLIFL